MSPGEVSSDPVATARTSTSAEPAEAPAHAGSVDCATSMSTMRRTAAEGALMDERQGSQPIVPPTGAIAVSALPFVDDRVDLNVQLTLRDHDGAVLWAANYPDDPGFAPGWNQTGPALRGYSLEWKASGYGKWGLDWHLVECETPPGPDSGFTFIGRFGHPGMYCAPAPTVTRVLDLRSSAPVDGPMAGTEPFQVPAARLFLAVFPDARVGVGPWSVGFIDPQGNPALEMSGTGARALRRRASGGRAKSVVRGGFHVASGQRPIRDALGVRRRGTASTSPRVRGALRRFVGWRRPA